MQLPSIAFLYEIFKKSSSVQTDTRKLKLGDIYFALKGPNFNGNIFVLGISSSGQ
jgi:UDP-N-acetylmuramoyl-tripeptide--D-alanyl-D-alanine ligase